MSTTIDSPQTAGPFQLTPDQQEIRAMANAFAAERLAPNATRWDHEHHLPVDVLRDAAELGMGGIYIREEHGGTGLGRLDAVVIFEAMGSGCPTVAAYLSIHNMVAWMVDRYGDDDQRATWLPRLCSMESLASYCLTEPDAGSDAAALKTRARREGDEYVLDGVKQFISGAGAADLYLVMARTGEPGPRGISAFLVEKGTPGLSFGREEEKLGWNAQPTRQVVLDGVRIPAANRLGDEGTGFRIALSGLDGGRLNIGACSLGGARAALEKAIAYIGEREAFGGPLSKLQAVRFHVADMATELEAGRALLWSAAAALDARQRNATSLCAMAKRFVTDVAVAAADRAVQLHGGYGYFGEYGVEKIARDLRVHQMAEGPNDIMRVIVAREVIGK